MRIPRQPETFYTMINLQSSFSIDNDIPWVERVEKDRTAGSIIKHGKEANPNRRSQRFVHV